MSEFDKEKEREKLREQFARDEQRRQSTQQMSELLLKGATMLNVHCADCASPIFRHEGEEFCPTCNRSVDELQTAGEAPSPTQEQAETESVDSAPTEPYQATTQVPREQLSIPDSNAGEALSATIARLADRAATAEDPRQAKELLEAAKLAAETLEILGGE